MKSALLMQEPDEEKHQQYFWTSSTTFGDVLCQTCRFQGLLLDQTGLVDVCGPVHSGSYPDTVGSTTGLCFHYSSLNHDTSDTPSWPLLLCVCTCPGATPPNRTRDQESWCDGPDFRAHRTVRWFLRLLQFSSANITLMK